MLHEDNAKLASLETIVSEKNDEVGTLKAALDKAKDDALTAVESEKRHTDDLIKREEKLLNTLMRQLNKAQGEQVQLDEYADEIDKVYDSLERLYASLKSDSRPLPIAAPPAAPGDDETTQLRHPSQLAARRGRLSNGKPPRIARSCRDRRVRTPRRSRWSRTSSSSSRDSSQSSMLCSGFWARPAGATPIHLQKRNLVG